jgi:hypothetical protein
MSNGDGFWVQRQLDDLAARSRREVEDAKWQTRRELEDATRRQQEEVSRQLSRDRRAAQQAAARAAGGQCRKCGEHVAFGLRYCNSCRAAKRAAVAPNWRYPLTIVCMAILFVMPSWKTGALHDVETVVGLLLLGVALVLSWRLCLAAALVGFVISLFAGSGLPLPPFVWALLYGGIGLVLIVWLEQFGLLDHLVAGVVSLAMLLTRAGRRILVHGPGKKVDTASPAQPGAPPAARAATAAGGSGHFEVVIASALPTFSDIGGMAALKGELRETVGLVLRYPVEARALKVEHGGVLLYGPPGVGKSMFARAIGGEFRLNAVLLNAGNLSTEGLLGLAAQKVGEAFAVARANLPCLVFIDELETVAGRRDEQNADRSTVGAFLTQLDDAVKVNGLVVVGATNHLDWVDEAVRRPGRFDLLVAVTVPDAKGREAIVRAHLAGRAHQDGIDLGWLVRETEGWSGAQLELIVKRGAAEALQRVATGLPAVISQHDVEVGFEKVRSHEETVDRSASGWSPA